MKNKTVTVILATLLTTTTASAADAIITRTGNLRAGPGTGYVTQGAIPAGSHVNVRLCKKNWCKISYSGQKGWMSLNLLAFNQSPHYYVPGRPTNNGQLSIIIGPGGRWPYPPFYRPPHHHHHYRPYPPYYRPRPPFPPPYPPPYRPPYHRPYRGDSYPNLPSDDSFNSPGPRPDRGPRNAPPEPGQTDFATKP